MHPITALQSEFSLWTRDQEPVLPVLRELNIGHFLIGEAVFVGLDAAIRRMRTAMDEAVAGASR